MSLEKLLSKPRRKIIASKVKETIRDLPKNTKQTAKEYPRNFGNILLQMGPAFIVAINGAKLAGTIAEQNPDLSNAAINGLTYLGGTIGGYGTFYAQEFVTNRKNYPKLASNEFLHFCGTFAVYDYVADAAFYTPEFLITNNYLLDNGIDPASSATLASLGAGICYMAGSAAFYKKTHELSLKTISGLKSKIKEHPRTYRFTWCVKDLVETSIESYDFAFKPFEATLDYIGDNIKFACSKINEKYPVLNKKII